MASSVIGAISLVASESGRRKQVKMAKKNEKKADFMRAQQEDKAARMESAAIKKGASEANIKNKRLKAYKTKSQSLLAPADDLQLGA